jgi:hypothetical protein
MYSLACLVLAAAPVALAPSDQFPIADKGILRFALPQTWKEVGRKTPVNLPPTFSFARSGPVRAALELTVVWSAVGDPQFNAPENLRKLTLMGQVALKGGTVEDELPLKPLKGAAGQGFVYSATDKNSKGGPGDFPVLTHGELPAGNLVLSFTALSASKDDVAVQEALGALQKATLVSARASRDISVAASPGATTLEGNGVRVALALDGFEKNLGYQALGRTYARLGQFSLAAARGGSPDTGLVVSVLVDDVPAGTGLDALKAHVLRSYERDAPRVWAIEAPPGFAFTFQRSVADSRLTNWHFYFETIHEGKWIELHFSSVLGPSSTDIEGLHSRALTVVRSLRASTPAH